MNLATNARDAMDDGGALRISVGRSTSCGADADGARHRRGRVRPHRGRRHRLGHGRRDPAARCFEPLFTTKGPSKGTGLGLPAARRVVVESGGSIDVHEPARTRHRRSRSCSRRSTARPRRRPTAPPATERRRHRPARRGRGRHPRAHRRGPRATAASRCSRPRAREDALEVARADRGADRPAGERRRDGGMTGGELAAHPPGASGPSPAVVLVSGNVDATVVESVREGTGVFLAEAVQAERAGRRHRRAARAPGGSRRRARWRTVPLGDAARRTAPRSISWRRRRRRRRSGRGPTAAARSGSPRRAPS